MEDKEGDGSGGRGSVFHDGWQQLGGEKMEAASVTLVWKVNSFCCCDASRLKLEQPDKRGRERSGGGAGVCVCVCVCA